MRIRSQVRNWHVPLSRAALTLRQAHADLAAIGAKQKDIPFLVQLVENPKFDIPGIDLFHGATDLLAHDRIHIVLGRGLLAKDEAFVIGFTMGSTGRVNHTEEWMYGIFARYLYPREYRFTDTDIEVFRDAVRLGFVSDCKPLDAVDYEALLDLPLGAARELIGIEDDLLRAFYAIEKRRYPDSFESQRLLD